MSSNIESGQNFTHPSITRTVFIAVRLPRLYPLYVAVVTMYRVFIRGRVKSGPLPVGLTLKTTKTKISVSVMIVNNVKGDRDSS